MKRMTAAVALVAFAGLAVSGGCAAGDKRSAAGGTGTGMAGDVEYGRGTGSHTGIGTMGRGAEAAGGSGAGGGETSAPQAGKDMVQTGGTAPGGTSADPCADFR